jgi:hypothetical protein
MVSGSEPRNCRVAHIVAEGTIRAIARLRPSPVRARISARSNSASPGQYRDHQAAVRRGCVGPMIYRGPQVRALLAESGEQVEQVARRAHEPVKPPVRRPGLKRASAFLSVTAPLIFAAKAFSPASWASSVCPSVETRAYPKIILRSSNSC